MLQDLDTTAFHKRIPYTGVIELTQRCNLRCVHCYLTRRERKSRKMIDYSFYCRILDELAEAGCVDIFLTGGEILFLRQFEAFYRASAERGFVTRIVTNATLMSQNQLDLFAQLPPGNIQVTIYGSKPETYDAFTGVRGSFERFERGLELIRSAGISLTLRYIVVKGNQAEYEDIRRFASHYCSTLKTCFLIFPSGSDPDYHLSARLDPEEMAAMELEDPYALHMFMSRRREFASGRYSHDDLFPCAAGMSTFFMTVDGHLQICGSLSSVRFDLKHRSFMDVWRNDVPEIRFRKRSKPLVDENEAYSFLSAQCAARSVMYGGTMDEQIPYLTELYAARLKQWKRRGLDE